MEDHLPMQREIATKVHVMTGNPRANQYTKTETVMNFGRA